MTLSARSLLGQHGTREIVRSGMTLIRPCARAGWPDAEASGFPSLRVPTIPGDTPVWHDSANVGYDALRTRYAAGVREILECFLVGKAIRELYQIVLVVVSPVLERTLTR
jgi:hypothetical protein